MARNKKLNSVERILDGKIRGPESVAARGTEEIFVSLHGGKILKLWGPRFDHFKIVASIGPGCGRKPFFTLAFEIRILSYKLLFNSPNNEIT